MRAETVNKARYRTVYASEEQPKHLEDGASCVRIPKLKPRPYANMFFLQWEMAMV